VPVAADLEGLVPTLPTAFSGLAFLPLDPIACRGPTNFLRVLSGRAGLCAVGQRDTVAPEFPGNCVQRVQCVQDVPGADALDALDDVFPRSAATLSAAPTSTLVQKGDRTSARIPIALPEPKPAGKVVGVGAAISLAVRSQNDNLSFLETVS